MENGDAAVEGDVVDVPGWWWPCMGDVFVVCFFLVGETELS